MPPFPSHLTLYMPGYMDLSPMRPNELWDTDATDLHLGRAVQEAWRDGLDDAKQSHQADEAMQQRIAERRQTAC